jgi:cytochrome oxidase Cu insertion factor (SCO1/SenC/PrrC family)
MSSTVLGPRVTVRGRVEHWIERLTGNPFFWVVLVGAVTAFCIGRALFIRLPPPLPVLGAFPPFELLDQTGEPFGTSYVRGRVWVAGVLSTTDPGADAALGRLRTIQNRARNLGTSFRVVAVTGDPEHDSPDRLTEFLRGRHTSPRLWSFVTGEAHDLAPLLEQFGPPGEHRPFLLLVDGEMHIRARYRTDEPDVAERVLRDVGLLANRGG